MTLELLPKGVEIKLEDGHQRYIFWGIKPIYELQEMFDKPIEQILNEEMLKGDDPYGTIAKILKVLLNDDARRQKKHGKDIPELDEEYLLEYLDAASCHKLTRVLIMSFNGTLPKSEEKQQKNDQSEQ